MTTAYQAFNLEEYDLKNVTVPFLVMKENTPYFVKFDSPIEADKTTFSERVRKSRDGDESKKIEPMRIADVTVLMDCEGEKGSKFVGGESARLVAHSVLESNLTEKYPDGAYNGKAFRIEKVSKAQGRRYFTFNIKELVPKAKTAQEPAKVKK